MLKIFKISGDSLYPFYKNGQKVICHTIFQQTAINVEDTVVFQKEKYGLMIKKITSINSNGYFVEGTDPLSIDSRNFGTIQRKEILYKVLFSL